MYFSYILIAIDYLNVNFNTIIYILVNRYVPSTYLSTKNNIKIYKFKHEIIKDIISIM